MVRFWWAFQTVASGLADMRSNARKSFPQWMVSASVESVCDRSASSVSRTLSSDPASQDVWFPYGVRPSRDRFTPCVVCRRLGRPHELRSSPWALARSRSTTMVSLRPGTRPPTSRIPDPSSTFGLPPRPRWQDAYPHRLAASRLEGFKYHGGAACCILLGPYRRTRLVPS